MEFDRIEPKLSIGMTGITWNGQKFGPRWNEWVSHSGLFTGTVFSGHSGWNGTNYTVINQIVNN